MKPFDSIIPGIPVIVSHIYYYILILNPSSNKQAQCISPAYLARSNFLLKAQLTQRSPALPTLAHTHTLAQCVVCPFTAHTNAHTHTLACMQTQIERILSTLSPLCIALLCVAFLRLHSPCIVLVCFAHPTLRSLSRSLSLLCALPLPLAACSNNTRTQDVVCVFIECSPRGII